jgi:hypothetical protein
MKNHSKGEVMKTTMKLSIFLPMAAVLTLGVASVCAQESVKMTFSGTSENSATNLQQPDTSVDEDVFEGTGTLGSFTLRNLRAILNFPVPSNTCSGPNDEPSGAGVFRFQDGSLLYVQLKRGDDCIDFTALVAHCTLIFQINGGTGRFSTAQGTLKLTETAGPPVLFDALGNPVYFGATGQITGTVWGVSGGQN